MTMTLLHRSSRRTDDRWMRPQCAVMAALPRAALEDLGFARVDHHRSVRQGFPEVVLGLGKTPDQIAKIAVADCRPRTAIARHPRG